MTNITLSKPTFFWAGVIGASAVVGFESGVTRVARYSFTAPPGGASQVSLTLTGLHFTTGSGGIRPTAFRFYIGTDPDSHKNAGASDECSGLLEITGTDAAGTASVLLLPETEYYLFLFPNTASLSWMSLELAKATLTAAGGSHSVPTLASDRVELQSPLTVYTNPFLDRFTHTLTLSFAGRETVLAEGVGEEFVWTPPMELALDLPNSTRGVATIHCVTCDGGTQIGTPQSVSVELCLPEHITPTVSATWSDSSPAYDAVGSLVKLVSALQVDVTAQGAWGSTVTAAQLFLQGKAYYGGVLLEAGELTLTVTVTDSRGREASVSYPLSVLDYATPQLSLNASRCRADGTPDDTGEFALVTLSGHIAPLAGQNRGFLSTSFGEEVAVSGDFAESFIIPAPSEQTLSITACLADKLAQGERSMVLSVGYATLDFLRGGRGIAFGTTATEPGFACAMPARFTGGLYAGEAALFPPHEPDMEYLTPHYFLGRPVYSRVVTVPAGLTELYHGIGVQYALSAVGTVWGARFDREKLTLPEAAAEEAHLLLCYTKGESQ